MQRLMPMRFFSRNYLKKLRGQLSKQWWNSRRWSPSSDKDSSSIAYPSVEVVRLPRLFRFHFIIWMDWGHRNPRAFFQSLPIFQCCLLTHPNVPTILRVPQRQLRRRLPHNQLRQRRHVLLRPTTVQDSQLFKSTWKMLSRNLFPTNQVSSLGALEKKFTKRFCQRPLCATTSTFCRLNFLSCNGFLIYICLFWWSRNISQFPFPKWHRILDFLRVTCSSDVTPMHHM